MKAKTPASQKRAVESYRLRLREHGLSRYEVRGLAADKELIRALASRLTGKDAKASALRAAVQEQVQIEKPRVGGVLEALRRSPLVGAGLRLVRPRLAGRRVRL